VDTRQFREAMNRPAVARELFLPLDRAWWDGGRFTLGRWAGSSPRPALRGVRLHEPAPRAAGPPPERDTQADLGALVASVAELRKAPGLAGLVLSEELIVGEEGGAAAGRRIVFGLRCPPGSRSEADDAAAGECYRIIRRSIERAGYRIEHPKERFHPAGGFPGLRAWASSVRLRRKTDPRRFLLPLLFLPLLLLPWWACQPKPPAPDNLFGVTVEADSFIILLDKSASMGPYIAQVRDEARKLLEERSRDPARPHFADLIVYDAEQESVLGDVQPVTPERIGKVTSYLNAMKAGGWTRVAGAVDLAAKEVAKHGKKTELIVLTDGEDKTIPQMINDRDKIVAKFGGVPFTLNATTPRLFARGADPRPATAEEIGLAELCRVFNGRFGPAGAVP
jgi:hypothetical protein